MVYSVARWLMIAAAALGLLASPASALTTYYVDPSWTGSQTGAAATPWTSLAASGAWSTVNTRLATDDVTVYFAATRTTTTAIDLNRTDKSTHRLTLDGISQSNTTTAPATPSWATNVTPSPNNYRAASKFQITAQGPIQSASLASPTNCLNYVTIQGFRLIRNGSGAQIANLTYVGNLVFQYNEGSVNAGVTGGPGVYVGPVHGPSCPVDNVQVLYNDIHDTYGECIYVGSASPTGDPPGNPGATPSGDNYLIQGNTITNCGTIGGQGDGIDVKDGHTNLRVIDNVLTWPNITADCDCSAIILESGDLVEGNYIEAPQKNAIYAGTGWDNTVGRNALVIRNNVVVNVTVGPGHRNGIELEGASSATYQWSNTKVHNNSIYRTTDACVEIGAPQGAVTVTNNIFQACGNNGIRSAAAGILTTHDYNQYFNITAGSALANAGVNTSCADVATVEPHSKCGDPRFVNTSPPYTDASFKPQAGSPVLTTGIVIATFTTDYFRNLRGLLWDIGAIQVTGVAGGGTAPGTPASLVVQ